mgnify:CR=1 FL=1
MTETCVKRDGYYPVSLWRPDKGEKAIGRFSAKYKSAVQEIRQLILDNDNAVNSVETGQYLLITCNEHTFRARICQMEYITRVYIHPDDKEAFLSAAVELEKSVSGRVVSPWKPAPSLVRPSNIQVPYTIAKSHIQDEFILKHPDVKQSILDGSFIEIAVGEDRFRVCVRSTLAKETVYIHPDDVEAYRRCVLRIDGELQANGVDARPPRFHRDGRDGVTAR